MRDSMVFYRSFFEAIKDLNFEQQGIIFNAIFDYGLNFKEPKLEGICKTVWTLIKPQLDANIKKFHNGKQPKEKQNISKPEANNKQNISKSEANVNVNVNDNVNVNELTKVSKKPRKTSFEESEIFDKFKFKDSFPDWGKEKLAHYYEAAERYSIEGNKYVSWKLAIQTWAKKDELKGVKVESEIERNKTEKIIFY
jgi:hypothetical protein